MAIELKYPTAPPQRNYKFRVVLGDSKVLLPEHIQNVSIKYWGVSTQDYVIGGIGVSIPGNITIESMTIDFIETNEGIISKELNNWRLLIKSDDGLYYYRSNYAKTITVDVLNEGNEIHSSIEYLNCWPTTTSVSQFSYASSEPLVISQEFYVDGYNIK